MSNIPFGRVLEFLESAGYRIRNRRSYPGRHGTYFYYFYDPSDGGPLIGFPVVGKQVSSRYFQIVQDTIKNLRDEDDETEKDDQ